MNYDYYMVLLICLSTSPKVPFYLFISVMFNLSIFKTTQKHRTLKTKQN